MTTLRGTAVALFDATKRRRGCATLRGSAGLGIPGRLDGRIGTGDCPAVRV